jgi:hypothetical protein
MFSMTEFSSNRSYAIAVPDSAGWEKWLRKLPKAVCDRLNIDRTNVRLYLVSAAGAREV